MKRNRIKIALVFCLMAINTFAGGSMQWVTIDRKELASKLEALNKLFVRLQHCEVKMTDASYEDYTSPQYHERMTGYYKRNGKEFYTYMLGIHTIQGIDCRLVIDSAKKVFVIGDPTNSMNNIMDANTYATMLKACSSIRMSTSDGNTYYHLEFGKGFRLSSYDFSIGKDSLLQKIVLYYAKDIKTADRSSKPRMEITFSDWKKSVKYSGAEFDIDRYVYKKGDDYFLKAPYAGKFKLLDERVLSKTAKK